MSIWDMIVEGLVEDVVHSVPQEDMDWYLSNTYVDPAECVE